MKNKLLPILVLTFISLSSFGQTLTDSLVGHWTFTGNANDISATGNHGTVFGATLVDDRFGNTNSAYSFDGDDYIDMLYPGPSGDTSRTISFWAIVELANTPVLDTGQTILSYGDPLVNGMGTRYRIQFNRSCQGFGVDISEAVYTKPATISTAGEWHHYCVVYDNSLSTNLGSGTKLYVDGVLDNSASCFNYNTTLNVNTDYNLPIVLGRNIVSGFPRYFKGSLDDFYIYNRALSGSEVETLFNEYKSTETITACNEYTWPENNTSYLSTGSYNFSYTSVSGLDSSFTLNLTINNSDSIIETVTACDSYTWPENGSTYFSSGIYTTQYTNLSGCDSVVLLDLSINYSVSLSETISACGSYTWTVSGNTYFNTGVYTVQYANEFGCDSVLTLNLTINNSDSLVETVSACGSYTWPENGITYLNSGLYTNTFINLSGCDSIRVLELTFDNDSVVETVAACESYTWEENGSTYFNSGAYTSTYTNMFGCDSIRVLYLTITNVDTSVIQSGVILTSVQSGATYQWLDCKDGYSFENGEINQSFMPNGNGNFAVEITLNGCVDTSACFVVNSVGLSDLSFSELKCYPNPTTDFINIELGSVYDNVVVEIYDMVGKVIYKDLFQNKKTIQMDLAAYSDGVYYIGVTLDNQKYILRVIKEK